MNRAPLAQAGLRGDVVESSAAEVLEPDVAPSDDGDKQVRQAVLVDVGKRSGDTDLVCESDSRFGGDVLKLALPRFRQSRLAPS